jgi:hypothetical protein
VRVYRSGVAPLAAPLLAALYGCQVGSPPPLRLDGPASSFPSAFASVDDLREIKDGVLLMIDGAQRSLVRLDWATGQSRRVGRTGDGPGEYRSPWRLFPYVGDSALVLDLAGRMYVASDAGELVALPRPEALRTSQGGVRGVDRHGNLFLEFERSLRRAFSGSEVWTESLTIARVDPRLGRIDTVARIAPAPGSRPILGNGATYSTPNPRPLATRDQWIVASDGAVAIAHFDPYRVEFVEPDGRRTVGASIPFVRVGITPAMRADWEQQQKRFPFPVSESAWPEHIPPFLEGALRFDAEGRLWIARTPVGGRDREYDVVGRNAAVVARIAVPAESRVVAFGARAIYLARSDADGFERLERHEIRIPEIE